VSITDSGQTRHGLPKKWMIFEEGVKKKRKAFSVADLKERGVTPRDSTSWHWLQIYLLDLGAAEKKGLIDVEVSIVTQHAVISHLSSIYTATTVAIVRRRSSSSSCRRVQCSFDHRHHTYFCFSR
jgi:hypothetical protein